MENTQKHKPEIYTKDYTKLETIFNNAVEKSRQNGNLYYISDRLYPDSERENVAQESLESVSWAESSGDKITQTHILKRKRLIKLNPLILREDVSLLDVLENYNLSRIKLTHSKEVVRLNKGNSNYIAIEETLEQNKEFNRTPANLLPASETLEDPNVETKELCKPEEPTKEEMSETLNETYIENQPSLETIELPVIGEDIASQETYKSEANVESEIDFSPQLTEPFDPEKLLDEFLDDSEDMLLEDYEGETDLIDLQTLVSNSFDTGELKFNKDDLNLLDAIQGSSVSDTLLSEDDKDQFIDLVNEETIEAEPTQSIEDTIELVDATADLTKKTDRRVTLEDIEEEIRLASVETPVQEEIIIEEIPQEEVKETALKNAYKDLTASKVSFIGSVALLLIYSLVMFPTFQGYDYIALILAVIGIFLAWDLSGKKLIIVSGLILVTLVVCMVIYVYQTEIMINFYHYLWFLFIPIAISTSYAYINSKRNYNYLTNKKSFLVSDAKQDIVINVINPEDYMIEEAEKKNQKTTRNK